MDNKTVNSILPGKCMVVFQRVSLVREDGFEHIESVRK